MTSSLRALVIYNILLNLETALFHLIINTQTIPLIKKINLYNYLC